MSGRGSGRGNSGRGGGRTSSNSNSGGNNKIVYKPSKKTLSDYVYYLGSAKQAADYETTTEFIINHIKKTFDFGNDIATALEDLQNYNIDKHKPKLQFSDNTLDEVRDNENEQYKIEFKAEFDGFMKRKQSLETNTTKAYALLWEQCAKGMQHKVESRSEYDKLIKSNPIELLKAIKEHALNFQEHRYEMSILLDALRAVINLKQNNNETLQEYTKRFKTSRDVLVSHIGGPIVFTKFTEKMVGYDKKDEDKVQSCVNKSWMQFLAYAYLENSDKSKYGTLLNGLQTQQSLKNDQYPKTITEATNVLSNHRFDNTSSYNNNNKIKNESSDSKIENEEKPEMSFANIEGKCYCCGKSGHKSPTCRLKDKIPKEDWAINKAKINEGQSYINSEQSKTTDDDNKSISESSTSSANGWSGAHVQFYQAEEMKNWILLDNGSTVNLFCNPELVENIKTTSETLELSTNGGDLFTNQRATVPGFGEVWYNKNAITNIFSLAELEKKYRVTYDSKKEKAFIIYMPNKILKFIKSENGLYYYKPKYKTSNKNTSLVNHSIESVDENKKLFTNRQVEQAKLARNIYHALGTPSVHDFKAIIKSNQISNIPITIDDINIAEKIFGPDVGALKGKTTRQKPAPVVADYIEIPKELIDNHSNITLCLDGMKINGVNFLTTISRNIMYRTAEWVPSNTMQAYRSVLDNVFRTYNRAGFKITTINCDNEFQPLMHQLQDVYNVRMNYANPQEHVPEAERNNRVIKERFRANFHRLPYQKIPNIMVKILTMECAKKLNFFPPKGGISPYYSPRMILHQQSLDYNKHCLIPFGSYVQAHHEPDIKNTQHPRTLDCIYLRYVDNDQGGHNLLDIRTGHTIKRRTVTIIPITKNVIELVHNMAENDNMRDGLKIETKSGTILYDSSWIVGVDYDDDDDFIDGEEIENPNDNEIENQNFDAIDANEVADLIEENIQQNNINEANNENIQQNNINEENNENEVDEYNNDNNNDYDDTNPSENENEIEIETENNDELNIEEEYDEELYNYDIIQSTQTTRSGRATKAPERLGFLQHHIFTQGHKETEYTFESSKIIAKTIHYLNNIMHTCKHNSFYKFHNFVVTYSLKKGLKEFGKKGYDAAFGEVKQLHDRVVFRPVNVNDLTPLEKKRALESLIFLVEKRDGRVKGRACANGSTQRDYINKEDAASPTAVTESILITATIDAKENRDVMSADIPNAFVQTDMIQNNNEQVVMKIRGALVDMLLELDPELYGPFVVYENGEKVLYVILLKALYGTLQAALLFYKKLKKDLESIGFKINPYDPCVANRTINGKQHTVTWHVDDLKSSHVDPKVNDEFFKWLEKMYGDPNVAPVKATRGKIHDYLAMKLDFTTPGSLIVDMKDYVKNMITDFPEEISTSNYPWNENLFKVDEKSPKLSKEKSELFHTFVAKALFLCKRARPDIQPAIAFLTTRVKAPNHQDWFKLVKMMCYLNSTQNDVLKLNTDESFNITWHLDAAFAVHNDKKSHTGATMSLGNGAICSVSTKQKVNTRSSTEAELVSIDDVISKVIWTKKFLQSQGFAINQNILLRDNLSSMKLELNGKTSSGKRTRHFDIKYFYITDLIERKEVTIKYCPTDEMVSDYMTKPLTGKKFHKFKKSIMNNG